MFQYRRSMFPSTYNNPRVIKNFKQTLIGLLEVFLGYNQCACFVNRNEGDYHRNFEAGHPGRQRDRSEHVLAPIWPEGSDPEFMRKDAFDFRQSENAPTLGNIEDIQGVGYERNAPVGVADFFEVDRQKGDFSDPKSVWWKGRKAGGCSGCV